MSTVASPDVEVVIAGAGPAGATGALLLASCGRQVVVLERTPESSPVGAGILLQPNGLAVLYGLGFRNELMAAGHILDNGAVYDETGRIIMSISVPDMGEGLDHSLAIRRSRLAQVLEQAMDAEPLVTVLRGAEVCSADERGVVQYRMNGRSDRLRGELVIGADGVHSPVRSAGDFGVSTNDTGRRFVRTILDLVPKVLTGEYWTGAGLFGCAPLGDGSTYIYADAVGHGALDVEQFKSVWQEHLPLASGLLDGLRHDDILVNEVTTVHCSTLVAGRRVLIGDAAHAMAPTLGQGANSAFVDAATLAGCLVHADDHSAGLRRYDQLRRPAVSRVQRDSATMMRLTAIHAQPGRHLRDGAVRMLSGPRVSADRYRALQQTDPGVLHRQVASQWKDRSPGSFAWSAGARVHVAKPTHHADFLHRLSWPTARLPASAHNMQPWRIHEIASDFELEDVWALPTPGGPEDLDRLVHQFASDDDTELSAVIVRSLMAVRWRLGAVLGWDDPPNGTGDRVLSLRDRLPEDLRGGRSGPDLHVVPFTSVYQTDNEWVAEIANKTVHALMHIGWVLDGPDRHRGQMAVLVKPNGTLGKVYMTAIKPLRRALVYPPFIRSIGESWAKNPSPGQA